MDKEKLHQILSSLWKNDDSVGKTYYNQALQDVQTAIDLQEEPVSIWHDASEEPNDMSHCLIFYGCKESVGHYLRYEPVLYNKKEKMFVTSSFPHPTGYKVEQKSFDGGCVAEVYKDRRDHISISEITQWCYLYDLHNLSNIERTVKSLQEEPVSEFLNTESMIESYKQRLISQANGMKNSPLIDMCLASYKHGINDTLDTLNLSNIQRTVKNCKEPVSEELEEEMDNYLPTVFSKDMDGGEPRFTTWFKALRKTAIYFAKWQKDRMMADAADAMIGLPYENKDGGYTHLIDVSRPLPVGNNKIAIIFKED